MSDPIRVTVTARPQIHATITSPQPFAATVEPPPRWGVVVGGMPGPPGPPGPAGPPGPQGPPGPSGAGESYVHDQMTPATVWTVNHNLGFWPGGVQVTDSAGSDVEGDIDYLSLNQLTITFDAAISGSAYIS